MEHVLFNTEIFLNVLEFSSDSDVFVFTLLCKTTSSLEAQSEARIWRHRVLRNPTKFNPQTQRLLVPFTGTWKGTYFGKIMKLATDPSFQSMLQMLNQISPQTPSVHCLHVSDLTRDEFKARFQDQLIPVLFKGWKPTAMKTKRNEDWQTTQLFKVGIGHLNSNIKMTYQEYLHYSHVVEKGSSSGTPYCYLFERNNSLIEYDYPLHLFDRTKLDGSDDEENEDEGVVSTEYKYKWSLMGPQGSGTPFHVDVYNTHAWNHVVAGRKRVTLYHPNTVTKRVGRSVGGSVTLKRMLQNCGREGMLSWYSTDLPQLESMGLGPDMECILEEGDTLYIPQGWWHQVINLVTPTIAVTENYF
eukprot:PhF_6_TR9968/c0_g1_i1/m.15140